MSPIEKSRVKNAPLALAEDPSDFVEVGHIHSRRLYFGRLATNAPRSGGETG